MENYYLCGMERRMRKYFGYGLLSLFVAYTAFLVTFYHVDIVSGRLVAHAHYRHIDFGNRETPAPTTHTQDQLVFLQQLSSITTFGTAIITAPILVRFDKVITTIETYECTSLNGTHHIGVSLRAPPTLF